MKLLPQKSIAMLSASAALLFGTVMGTRAAAQEPETKTLVAKSEPEETQTFVLKNVTWTNDVNDVATDLRNALPRARMYAIASQM